MGWMEKSRNVRHRQNFWSVFDNFQLHGVRPSLPELTGQYCAPTHTTEG